MIVAQVVWAEVRKLFSRPLARVGLVLIVLLGAVGPAALWMLVHSGISMNNSDLAESLDATAANAVRWSLHVRNFFTIHVLLTLLAALSYAGELQAHTLREDLVRPVPRSVVLFAKWAALATWSFAGIVLQLAVAAALGSMLHPLSGAGTQWGPVLLAYAASWASEVGYAAFALAAAVLMRSLAGTLAGVFLFLVFERGAGWTLTLVNGIVQAMPAETNLGPLRELVKIIPFLPSTAWGVWADVAVAAPMTWEPWTGLALITVVSVVVAERIFAYTDVP